MYLIKKFNTKLFERPYSKYNLRPINKKRPL